MLTGVCSLASGVWGSAFTILIKRLVMEGGKKDIVQIMRDAQKEENMAGEWRERRARNVEIALCP